MASTCFLYVLPLVHEDLVKIGISNDPLRRAREFAARYYELFDLRRSALVEYDSAREARRRETALHRQLRSWNAVQPITVPTRAGGFTEWYRGARERVLDTVALERGEGHPVHAPAAAWWRARLIEEQPLLYEWGCAWCARLPDIDASHPAWRELADVLDAWPALGLEVASALPPELAQRYARYREAWRPGLST